MRRTSSLTLIAVVSMSLILAGCTATPDAEPTPTAAAAAIASPTPVAASPTSAAETPSVPSATPTTEQPADDEAGDWTLSADGYGPLRIGDAFDAATTEVGPYVRGRECADPEYLRYESDEFGSMVVILDDDMAVIESIMLSAEPGQTIPASEAGVRPGSDLATVLAAYPDAAMSRQTPGGGTYAVPVGTTFLAFAIDEGIVLSAAASMKASPFREYCS